MHGLTGKEFFHGLTSAMALTRKGLRFWGPIKAMDDICTILDKSRDAERSMRQEHRWIDALSICGAAADKVYRLVDHVAFAERIKLIKLSVENVDRLDRFIETFWLAEIIPTVIKDVIQYTVCRKEECALLLRQDCDCGDLLQEVRAQKRRALLNLFKVGVCDLGCIFFVMRHASFKGQRKHRIWCGVLGVLASLIASYWHWTRVSGRNLLHDYPLLQKRATPGKVARDPEAATIHRGS